MQNNTTKIFRINQFHTWVGHDNSVIKMPIERVGDTPLLGFKHTIRNYLADTKNTLFWLAQNGYPSDIIIRQIDMKKRVVVKKNVGLPIYPKTIVPTIKWETTLLQNGLIRRMPVLENMKLGDPFLIELSVKLYIQDVKNTMLHLSNSGYR